MFACNECGERVTRTTMKCAKDGRIMCEDCFELFMRGEADEEDDDEET